MSSTSRVIQEFQQTTLYKITISNNKQHKSKSTYQKNTTSISHLTENKLHSFSHHPAAKYIGSQNVKLQQYKKFIHLLYYGLTYCVKNLKGPTDQYLRKKSVTLPQSEPLSYSITPQNKKKFLMLDLDETLIHSVFDSKLSADVKLFADGNQFRFNVRPHCLQFLQNMSEHYQIFVFTASTKDYAQPIVKYLNKKRKTIKGILHRKNCLQTMNGFKIKDLRIIKNRSLQQIILVDNLVHSFGLQLDNGIPIIQFTSNKNDCELLHLQKVLYQAKQHKDVRQFIRDRINIKKCLEYNEKDFLNVNASKWSSNKLNHSNLSIMKEKIEDHEKSALKTLLTCGA